VKRVGSLVCLFITASRENGRTNARVRGSLAAELTTLERSDLERIDPLAERAPRPAAECFDFP
jgi:hypothetical protein